MSLQNLPEDRLYGYLPEGVVSLDEQRLMQAVLGGVQDRLDDARAFVAKLSQLQTGQGLPETGVNAVIARVQSPKGAIYLRSLEIHDDTPAAGDPALLDWVRGQLQLDEDHVLLDAAYGLDTLRQVNLNILPNLAATVGAVLYRTAAQDPANADSDARRLLQTWFPRLQFKGTAESFESLGRLLGFDDVRMTPLWTRLSPRAPQDIGAPANDPDFSEQPDFNPQQARSAAYDPWSLRDGPFCTWTGTASTRFGTDSTDFYFERVNGFNPFFKVNVLGGPLANPDPALSPYVLVGGSPEAKAYVNPSGTGLQFEAISAGSDFNGLAVQVQDWNSGTHRLLTVTDRLSSRKYRSSYYDLTLNFDFDHAEDRFSTQAVAANRDLAANPTSANFGSTALPPYRPWSSGSVTQGSVSWDWLSEVQANGTQTVAVVRDQATLTDRQLNQAALMAAAVQAAQAMEEVRPATRRARSVTSGYLMRDEVGYASFASSGTAALAVPAVGTYSGTLTGYPAAPYSVLFTAGTDVLTHEQDLTNPSLIHLARIGLAGTFNYANASWQVVFANAGTAANLYVNYQPASTEVVRANPALGVVTGYQIRPEDTLDESQTELADEYPWRRDLVGGGELVEQTVYNPPGDDLSLTVVDQAVAVMSQTGAAYNVSINRLESGTLQFHAEERNLDSAPGQLAVAYSGSFISLDQVSTGSQVELDEIMHPGWKLYYFGLVQGVLVADPVKFFGKHHREGLVAWFPFNECSYDDLRAVDHSAIADDLRAAWISPGDRQFDAARGWHLHLASGATLTSEAHRQITGDFSIGFWIRAPLTTAVSTVLDLDAFGVRLDGNNFWFDSIVDGVRTVMFSGILSAGWNCLTFTYSQAQKHWWAYQGTPASVMTAYVDGSGTLAWTNASGLALYGSAAGHDLQDLRVWNCLKNLADLELFRYHSPTPTAALYHPACLPVLNDGDRYGIRVLDTGWVTPDVYPSSLKLPGQAWVRRYDSMGRYQAQSRFKETGVGSGHEPPAVQQLGVQWNQVNAAGTATVSTWGTGMVGYNAPWLEDSPVPRYRELLMTGSTYYGIPGVLPNTGTLAPWPNALEVTNPCRDRVWVLGDDQYVWEVKVRRGPSAFTLYAERLFISRSDAELRLTGTEGTLAPILQTIQAGPAGHYQGTVFQGTIYPGQLQVVSGTDTTTDNGASAIVPVGQITGGVVNPASGYFNVQTSNGASAIKVYHPAKLLHSEQPTGAEVVLAGTYPAGNTTSLLRVSATGAVYPGTYSGSYFGTITSPDLYLYGNEETLVDYSGTDSYNAWVDKNNLGLSQTPPVAALPDSGELAFEVDQVLPAGYYRLEITSGNIGKVDDAFQGYHGVMTVGDTAFETRLCQNCRGADFSQTDALEFELLRDLPGSPSAWLLSFDWLNGLRDSQRGVARQLKISAFKLVRYRTTLYRVELAPPNYTLSEVEVGSVDFPVTPGGWLAVMTSWGTYSRYTHESTIYSGNDTVQSKQPLSDVLTATTVERKEDLIITGTGSYVVSDPPYPDLPSYGTISVT